MGCPNKVQRAIRVGRHLNRTFSHAGRSTRPFSGHMHHGFRRIGEYHMEPSVMIQITVCAAAARGNVWSRILHVYICRLSRTNGYTVRHYVTGLLHRALLEEHETSHLEPIESPARSPRSKDARRAHVRRAIYVRYRHRGTRPGTWRAWDRRAPNSSPSCTKRVSRRMRE